MSVVTPGAGEMFTIRIVKTLIANPSIRWTNTYEVGAMGEGAVSMSSLVGAATRLLDFESRIHLPSVQFVQWSISTWEPDSKPYDPTAFMTTPLPTTAIGLRSAGVGDPLSLEHCLYVKRAAPVGRQGKLMYRGVLGESDIIATAGIERLANVATMATLVTGAVASTNVDEMLQGGAYPVALLLAHKDYATSRYVTALEAAGVSINKFNHRWFDRAAPGA